MPPLLRTTAFTLAVLAATVLGVGLLNGTVSAPDTQAAGRAAPGGAPTTAERIRDLEREVHSGRHRQRARVALANAHLQRARETSDGASYEKAGDVLRTALRVAPRDPDALATMGALRMIYHQFSDGLAYARRAQRAAPGTFAPYPVIVDALIELGRYEAAGRALQEMVDLKPSVPAYARVSYFRELHGDLDGAIEAMELAISAGSATPENAASVRTLLGELHFAQGDLGAARRAHEDALHVVGRYGPALAGLARIDAAQGRYADAASGYRAAYERAPKPEYAIALAETLEAGGHRAAAREQWRFARRLLVDERKAGTMNANELALVEADHFDRRWALELAREAWAKAPSVVSADALGWALTRAGRPHDGLRHARRALAIGSRFPRFLVHAGLTAEAAGRPGVARRWLREALADNPSTPVWGPIAREGLRRLS